MAASPDCNHPDGANARRTPAPLALLGNERFLKRRQAFELACLRQLLEIVDRLLEKFDRFTATIRNVVHFPTVVRLSVKELERFTGRGFVASGGSRLTKSQVPGRRANTVLAIR